MILGFNLLKRTQYKIQMYKVDYDSASTVSLTFVRSI